MITYLIGLVPHLPFIFSVVQPSADEGGVFLNCQYGKAKMKEVGFQSYFCPQKKEKNLNADAPQKIKNTDLFVVGAAVVVSKWVPFSMQHQVEGGEEACNREVEEQSE